MPALNLKNIIKKTFHSRVVITLLIFLGFCFWSFYSVYVLNQTTIYIENELLENIQVLTLSIACLVFFLPIVRQKRNDKLFLLFFAFLCLGSVLREVDIEDLNVPNFLILIGSDAGRNIILATGSFAIFSCSLFNVTHYKKVLINFFLSRCGILIVTAGLLLCIGDFFEKVSLIQHRMFYEEMFELSGYVLILSVAFIYTKNRTTGQT
jgi:hypothetical protein